MRQAPEWIGALPGVAEPVSRKRPGVRIGIDGSPDEVPGLGEALPLVDQDGRGASYDALRVGLGHHHLCGDVKAVHRGGAALG